jgi:hypothetical protein
MQIKIPVIFGFLALPLLIGGLPTWVLKSEVLIVLTSALVYGFSAFVPRLPAWATCQEVRGVTLVALGCVCLFVPTQFILSALLVGFGARLVMSGGRRIGPPSNVIAIRQQPGEIVIRETTPMEKVR